MNNIANILILFGTIILLIGVIGKISPLFHLPGDIFIQKKNFTFYFPIVSCLIISIVLTILLDLFFRK